MSGGVSVEEVGRMWSIPQATALAEALVAALAELTVVSTGRTVSTGSYSFEYADIGDVVKLTRPILAKNGIVALTPVHDHGDGLACTVVLVHTSGERLDLGPFPFPHGKDAQATGSMVTYHRRYALIAALGMATGDDDDGASAKPREPAPAAPTPETLAKRRVLELAKGDKTTAKYAWAYIDERLCGAYEDGAAIDALFDEFMSETGTAES